MAPIRTSKRKQPALNAKPQPARDFFCALCGKDFTRKVSVRVHFYGTCLKNNENPHGISWDDDPSCKGRKPSKPARFVPTQAVAPSIGAMEKHGSPPDEATFDGVGNDIDDVNFARADTGSMASSHHTIEEDSYHSQGHHQHFNQFTPQTAGSQVPEEPLTTWHDRHPARLIAYICGHQSYPEPLVSETIVGDANIQERFPPLAEEAMQAIVDVFRRAERSNDTQPSTQPAPLDDDTLLFNINLPILIAAAKNISDSKKVVCMIKHRLDLLEKQSAGMKIDEIIIKEILNRSYSEAMSFFD